MVSRLTCGFSLQQNWIAVGRGRGKAPSVTFLLHWKSHATLPQLLSLPPGWHLRSRRCSRNFRLLFPLANIYTKWNRGLACLGGLLNQGQHRKRHSELNACCCLEFIFEVALKNPFFLFLTSNKFVVLEFVDYLRLINEGLCPPR